MPVQGTKILHSVTPVLSAKEDRISFVNSYGRRDVFAEDRTRFSSMMAAGDPEEIYELEYARHKAWRVMGQMKHLVEDMPFGTSVGDMAALMSGAAAELEQAQRLLLKQESDYVGFFKQTTGLAEDDGTGFSVAGKERAADAGALKELANTRNLDQDQKAKLESKL